MSNFSERLLTGRDAAKSAEESALLLYSISSAIIPDSWRGAYAKLAFEHALNFAMNARRLNEILNIKSEMIDPIEGDISPDMKELNCSVSYGDSINSIIHCRNWKAIISISKHKKWINHSNHLVVAIDLENEHGYKTRVNIHAISITFLTKVLGIANEKMKL